MRLLRNPMVQFLVASFLLFGATWFAAGKLSERAGRSEAVADAQATTELLARSVAEPALPRKLIRADPGAIDRFDRAVGDRLSAPDVRRIKIWRADGTVVYSDETDLIGQQFPLDAEQRQVLQSGTAEGVSPTSNAARTSSRPARTACWRSIPGSTHPRAHHCCSRPTTRWPRFSCGRTRCSPRSAGSRQVPCSRSCCSAYP